MTNSEKLFIARSDLDRSEFFGTKQECLDFVNGDSSYIIRPVKSATPRRAWRF